MLEDKSRASDGSERRAAHDPTPTSKSKQSHSSSPSPTPKPDPFRSLTAPAGHRSKSAATEPPGEPPAVANPTQSWSYRWLGVGVAAGAAAGFGIAAGATWLSTSLLSSTSSTLVVAGTLAFAAARGGAPLLLGLFGNRTFTHHYAYTTGNTERRMEETVRSLTVKAGGEMPELVPSSRVKNMALFDGPKGANVLLYNPTLVEMLTNRELEGIVAHELSHEDRYSTVSRVALVSARHIANVTTLVGTFSYCLAAGDGFFLSAALAIGGAMAVRTAIRSCSNIASRAEEMRTDIRAVELTGDLGSLVQGLRKTYEQLYASIPGSRFIRSIQFLASHPSLEMRERWLRRSCGN